MEDRRLSERRHGERRGPKPQRGDVASVTIQIRLTPNERADLEQVAKDNHTSLTDIIRESVNEFVADYRDKPVFPNA